MGQSPVFLHVPAADQHKIVRLVLNSRESLGVEQTRIARISKEFALGVRTVLLQAPKADDVELADPALRVIWP